MLIILLFLIYIIKSVLFLNKLHLFCLKHNNCVYFKNLRYLLILIIEVLNPKEGVIFINYGHEKNAVLQDEYNLAISKTDPIFSNNVELKNIYSFTKVMLEPNTISNNKLNSQEKYNSIKFDDFNFFEKTEKDEMKKFYFVFYNNISDFKNVTTFNTSEISYSFDGNKVVVNK